MAKNNKGGVKNAQVNNAEAQESAVNMAAMITNTGKSSMDRNHQVDLLKMMHETFRMDPNAAENTGFEVKTIEKLNHLSAIGIAVVFAQEAEFGTSDMAITLRKSCLPIFKEAMEEIGVTIGDVKLLENKTDDGEEVIEVPSSSVSISDETKKNLENDRKAKEASAGKIYDPTKIKGYEEFKEALCGLLSISSDGKLIDNIYKAIAFYLSYQKIIAHRELEGAEKTLKDTKDDEYKKNAKEHIDNIKNKIKDLNSMSNTDVFREIVKITGRVGLLAYGFANHLFLVTAQTGSPVSAWCELYASALDRKTGESKYSYEDIADIIKCLVEFEATNIVNKANYMVEEENRKPEKDRVKAHYETADKNIAYAKKTMDAIKCASSDFVTSLKSNYLNKDNKAHKTVVSIKNVFYRNVAAEKMSTVKIDSLLNCCTQYAGIISNLFRDPLNSLAGYSLDKVDHLEFKTPDEIAEEKKAAEKAAAEVAAKKAEDDKAKKEAALKAKEEEAKKAAKAASKEEKKKQVKK